MVTNEIKKKRIFYSRKIKPLRSNDSQSWLNAIKKVGYSKNNSQVFLSNHENGERLTTEDVSEEINKYFVNYYRLQQIHFKV